jgi:hypothetical protein
LKRFVNTSAPSIAPSLADLFVDIVEGIRAALGKNSGIKPRVTFAVGRVLFVVWIRLSKTHNRFTALYRKFRAGTLPKPRLRPRKPSARPRPAPLPDAPKLPPRSRGWLIKLLTEPWHVAAWRASLQTWLTDPELPALVLAAPQAGRILRPLLHMLAIDIPTFLRLPKRPRAPRERAPAAERPPRPRDINKMSSYAYGRLVHPPRDNNCPPIRLGYAPAKPFPKPDSR